MLCVYESAQAVPFDIRRVFTISSQRGMIRGDHAHRKCTQLQICVAGRIRVTCDDGVTTSLHTLESNGIGLLVPPSIWATEEYLEDGAVLMVLCDRGYETEDYIRNYDEFKAFLRQTAAE